MPTRTEVLTNFTNAVTRGVYIAMAETSKVQFTGKSVDSTVLNNFMQQRLHRITAIYDNTEVKFKNNDITSNYSLFKEMLADMRGQLLDLDQVNGRINQTVLGDARKHRAVKREMAELYCKISAMSDISDNFTTHIAEVNTLIEDITKIGNVA